jgi:hypothetical protein
MHLPFKIFSHNLQCISGPNIRDRILSLICWTQNRIFRARRTLCEWNGCIWLQCMAQHIKPTERTQCCTKRCRLALTFSLWYWTVILHFTFNTSTVKSKTGVELFLIHVQILHYHFNLGFLTHCNCKPSLASTKCAGDLQHPKWAEWHGSQSQFLLSEAHNQKC